MWKSGGPYGGDVTALGRSAAAPATLFAGTRHGLFRSSDAGGTWTGARGLSSREFAAVAAHPTDPMTVYVAGPGVFESTDGGGTWVPSGSGMGTVTALVLDPTTPATLYAGTWSGEVFKSTDAGGTWMPASTGLPERPIQALAVDPVNPATLYAGTQYEGVYKSVDAAGSWVRANTGLAHLDVKSLAVDPASPARVYAGVHGPVYRSTDSGGSWTAVGNAGPVESLTIDPAVPATLYAGTWDGDVQRSTDFGETWTPVLALAQTQQVHALLLDPTAPGTLYAGAWELGVLKSTDAGGTWAVSSTGLLGPTVGDLAVDPVGPSRLYAATNGRGVCRSTDAGTSWACASAPGPNVYAVVVDPQAPSTLYVTGGAVFKSTDAGGTWSPANNGLESVLIATLAIDPARPATLYAAASLFPPGGRVFKSTDAGGTWVPAGAGLPSALSIRQLAVDATTPATLYAAAVDVYLQAGGGVFKSTDAGGSWTAASAGLPSRVSAYGLAIDPATATTLYAATNDGPYRSTNSGGSWMPVNAGLPGLPVYAVCVDPGPPATLYAGTSTRGVYRSTDAGVTWIPTSAGLPAAAVLTLAPARRSANSVYAGLEDRGAWQQVAPVPKGDVNGDGLPDLLFRHTVDGTRHKAWFLNGIERTGAADVTPNAPGAEWELRGVDDFDADRRSDLVFWNATTGAVEFWLMNGVARSGGPVPLAGPVLDPGWRLSATADFGGDGWPDLVWRHATSRDVVIWTMDGTGKAGELLPSPSQAVDANWDIVAARDYNDDGHTDLLWYNATSGKLVTWYLDASAARLSGQFTLPATAGHNNWKVVASADYSQGSPSGTPPFGSPDIVWRNETSGQQVVWHMDFASARLFGEFTSPPANTPALDWTIVGPR